MTRREIRLVTWTVVYTVLIAVALAGAVLLIIHDMGLT